MPRCFPRLVDGLETHNWEELPHSLESLKNIFPTADISENFPLKIHQLIGPSKPTTPSQQDNTPKTPTFEVLDAYIGIFDSTKEPLSEHPYRIVFFEKLVIATASNHADITKDFPLFAGKWIQFIEIHQKRESNQLFNDFSQLLQEEYNRTNIGKQHNTFSKRSAEAQKKFIMNNIQYLQAIDTEGRTILHFAADSGSFELVKFILSFSKQKQNENENSWKFEQNNSPLEINACDFNGWTPLHCAVHNRHLQVAELLIQFGANVNSITKNHLTPLSTLVSFSDELEQQLHLLQILIENGADVSSRSIHLESPLHRAAWKSSIEVVEFLIENGANIHDVTQLNENALHYASMLAQNTQIIEFLLAQEIDETLSGVNGTPLQVASPSVKEFLQSYIEWKNNNNNNNEKNDSTTSFSQLQQRIQKNALHKACLQGDIKVVRRLLKRRVGINQVDENRISPVQYCAMYGFIEIVIVLLATNEIVIEGPCGPEGGLLHLLVRNYFLNSTQTNKIWYMLISALKTKNYDFSCQNSYGATALHEAAFRGNTSAISSLLSISSLHIITTKNGDTPLHYAVRGGHVGSVFLLLVAGIDKNIKNKFGFSAIDVAKEKGMSCKALRLV